MAVQAADILFYYTTGTGSPGAGTANTSLGGSISTTQMSSGLNGLFDNISGTDHAAGNTDPSKAADYRVIAVKIANPLADSSSSTLDNATFKIDSPSLGDSHIYAYAPASANHQITQGSGVDDTIPPTDGGAISFTEITNGVTTIALPTSLAPGDIAYIALKRTINAGSTAHQDAMTMDVTGDTV